KKNHSISIVARARQRVRSSHLIGSASAHHHSALAKIPALGPSHSRSRLATIKASDYSLLMPGRGKLGELPKSQRSYFPGRTVFSFRVRRPSFHNPSAPDSRRYSPASGEGEQRNSLVARAVAVERYLAAI